jgi:predicted nucleic acid-binding protein
MRPQIVLDTNVVYSAMYSRLGPAFSLLGYVGTGAFDIHLSVALAIQYEDVAKRDITRLGLEENVIDDILDYLCRAAHHQRIFYLWRPFLPDSGDDMVLELAVAARCSFIVTHNLRHFRGVENAFGIAPLTPLQFLKSIGA